MIASDLALDLLQMAGKQRKFRVKGVGDDADDDGKTIPAPAAAPPTKPAVKPSAALLSFDDDAGVDDGPSSMAAAPPKKGGSKDRKPKLARAIVPMPESVPDVSTTQRSAAGAHVINDGAWQHGGSSPTEIPCLPPR